ncbi:unnamed protein product [Orchesella dallaii]|uniref:Uncharacterized protein n=1 Tax=Orchesella dallaii TaxID=48710 RepID=A0ABP1RAM2_9HEXA
MMMETKQEDVSWHTEGCRYRGLVEHNHESNMHRLEEVRQLYVTKFTNDVLAFRLNASGGGKGKPKKKKAKSRAKSAVAIREMLAAPLNIMEEAFVKEKVDGEMRPGGYIRTYLENQRQQFEKYKEMFRRHCRCVKGRSLTAQQDQEDDPPMPRLEVEGGRPVVEVTKINDHSEEPMDQDRNVEEEDEEEDGLYF